MAAWLQKTRKTPPSFWHRLPSTLNALWSWLALVPNTLWSWLARAPNNLWKWLPGWTRTLLTLAFWVLAGLALYSGIYWLLSYLAGTPLSGRELVRRIYLAFAGEGGKESTTVLLAFVTGLLGFGAQQWRSIVEESRERRERRQRALEELENLRTLLREKRYQGALSLYWTLWGKCRKMWGDLDVEKDLRSIWEEMAPRPLQEWTRLCEEDPVSVPLAIETLEALVWGWRLDREHREQAKALLKRVVTPEYLEGLKSLVQGNLDLLRSDAIGQHLDDLESTELSGNQRASLNALQSWRREPLFLPAPWAGVIRPPDLSGIAQRLKGWGFVCNPFGPEWAEADPGLGEYGVWPASLEKARGLRPALVFGPPGSGKTATALLLWHKCLNPPGNPEESGVFPVHLEVGRWPGNPEEWLDAIGRAVAEALLQVCVRAPYSLLEGKTGSSIGQLLSCYWETHVLEARLREMGLTETEQNYIVSAIEEFATGYTRPDFVGLKHLIGAARPEGMQAMYLILDLPSHSPAANLSSVISSLACLVGWALPLTSAGLYLKIFVPAELQSTLQPSWPLSPLYLAWSEEELREVLQMRLQRASDGRVDSLRAVCSSTHYPPDPDTWLIRQAQESPRNLVRLGNQMLHEAAGASLS
jgi:hypothetical protein